MPELWNGLNFPGSIRRPFRGIARLRPSPPDPIERIFFLQSPHENLPRQLVMPFPSEIEHLCSSTVSLPFDPFRALSFPQIDVPKIGMLTLPSQQRGFPGLLTCVARQIFIAFVVLHFFACPDPFRPGKNLSSSFV